MSLARCFCLFGVFVISNLCPISVLSPVKTSAAIYTIGIFWPRTLHAPLNF